MAGKNTKLITASFAAGLLAHALEEEINIVNAEVLLRERGVELIEERQPKGPFSSVVLAEVETEKARIGPAAPCLARTCCGWSSSIVCWKPTWTAS